jgi:geranylgeranyl diphosphate synthase type I
MNAVSGHSALVREALVEVERRMVELVHLDDDVCGQMAVSHLSRGGKRLRARLAVEASLAMGGSFGAAIAWGVANELMHNASLIHDDAQDGDAMRRGAPAVWKTYGVPQAINAGDLLLMLPFRALEDASIAEIARARLMSCLARHGERTVRGQADEMSLRDRPGAGDACYRRAAGGKTSGLFGMPVEGAALLSGRSVQEARRLAEPFERLGLLYQMQDDVIDCFGDKGRGQRGSDLREGKVSALTVAHLELHPEDKDWLTALMRLPRHRTTRGAVADAIERFRSGGALARVLERIDELGDVEHDVALDGEPILRGVAVVLRDRFIEPLAPVRALLPSVR